MGFCGAVPNHDQNNAEIERLKSKPFDAKSGSDLLVLCNRKGKWSGMHSSKQDVIGVGLNSGLC